MDLLKSRAASEFDTALETEGEGEIRGFVQSDVANLRQRANQDNEILSRNIRTLLQAVAGTSIQGIEILIVELQTLRLRLDTESARVQREIVEYATLSQAAVQSTKIIAESILSFRSP